MDEEVRAGGGQGGWLVEGEGEGEGAAFANRYSGVRGLTLCCHGDRYTGASQMN